MHHKSNCLLKETNGDTYVIIIYVYGHSKSISKFNEKSTMTINRF